MKRMFSLLLAMALLCMTIGCTAPADTNPYAVALAQYPKLTSYTEEYDTVSKYEQSGMVSWEKMEKAYDALSDAMTAHNEELMALQAEAAKDLPDLTDFTAETTAALFAQREENTVYSPANLYMALAMLAEATEGDTRKEITALMGSDDSRTAANALWKMIYNDGRGKTLAANSMWTGEIVPVKQSLADTLAEHYYADTFTVPMGTDQADNAMHDWLNEHTGNLLQDAVESIKSDPSTILTLMSTLYFKQMWHSEFQAGNTYADTFIKADGSETETDFMHEAGSGAWYRGENYVMAARSFQDNGGRMVFILPDEGVLPEQLLTDGDTLAEILTAGHDQYSRIEWSVPKFDVDSSLELSSALQQLGIELIFDATASDFTPVNDEVDMAVSQVQHAARVTIDEYGCTAAAFTVIMVNGATLPPPEVLEMNLNRPFAFVILNNADVPLFIGTVYTP